jgi:hypothetical protein
MAIHRFKCSDDLNKEIVLFAEFHKFDLKDNLNEQFNAWIKKENIEKLIIKEEEFLKTNEYSGDITIKIFKSIKYYYIKKFLNANINPNEITATDTTDTKQKRKKVNVHYFENSFIEKIQDDIIENFELDRSFKPSNAYELFLKKNVIEGNKYIKKCYKNNYYQIKNKKYYVNE